MSLSRVHRGEVVSMVGALMLAVGVFLPWYALNNVFAKINETHGPGTTVSAWEALSFFRFLYLAAAVAPFILTYIVMRGHALTWPRGEVTAVVGIAAFVFVLVRGWIVQPGDVTSQIDPTYGYYISLVGTVVMTAGALMHRAEMDTEGRKPPGTM